MNKVKPFCIEYEDWMTDEQVQEVLVKAVKAGAIAEECVHGMLGDAAGFIEPHHWPGDFKYFGVMEEGQTWFSDTAAIYENNIIRLDEVDKHLTSADNVDVDALVLKIEALGYEVNLTKKNPEPAPGQTWIRNGSVTGARNKHIVAIVEDTVIYYAYNVSGNICSGCAKLDYFKENYTFVE